MPATILYVITELDIGGAEKALFELVRRLDPDRYAAEVACLSGHGDVGDWLADLGVPVHYLGVPAGRGLVRHGVAGVRRLRRIVRDLRPHIVHTFLFHANLIGRLAARPGLLARRPAVVGSVRVAERRHRWHLLADGLTRSLIDCEVCVSEGVRRFTHRYARIPLAQLRVIPNGVNLEAIDAVRPVDPGTIGCDPDRPILCFVGRLDPQKGITILLEAVARVEPSCQVVLVGDGPQRGELAARAAALGIGDRVHFTGWRPDAAAVMAASDVFVLPSLWEGMPNALMEAMALGRCAVASAVEGSDELIDDGVTGLLVPAGAVAPLAERIALALADTDRRRQLGRAARRRIAERFTIERAVTAYDALYRELLATREVPVRAERAGRARRRTQ